MELQRIHRRNRLAPFAVSVTKRRAEITYVGTGETPGNERQWNRAYRLSQMLHGVVDDGAETVVVDLLDVDDVHTSLLAVLVDAMIHARTNGAHLVTLGSQRLHDLAGICRLEGILFPAGNCRP